MMSSMMNGAAPTKRRKKPTIAETREAMAQAGDVEGLWHIISETPWTLLDLEGVFRLLLRAIENATRSDPARFAGDLFTRMLSFTGYLLFRSHYYARDLISGYDKYSSGRGSRYLPPEVTETLLPRLVELQHHVGELVQMHAHTSRLWELAREKRLKNDLAERRHPTGDTASGVGEPAQTNGTVPDRMIDRAVAASANQEAEDDFGRKSHEG
jgi:hypothetical protein